METGRRLSQVDKLAAAKDPSNPFTWKPRIIEDQFNQSMYDVYDYIYGTVSREGVLCLSAQVGPLTPSHSSLPKVPDGGAPAGGCTF